MSSDTEVRAHLEIWGTIGATCLAIGLFSVDALYAACLYIFGLGNLISLAVKLRMGEAKFRLAVKLAIAVVMTIMAHDLTSKPEGYQPKARMDRTFVARSWGAVLGLGLAFPLGYLLIWGWESKSDRRR